MSKFELQYSVLQNGRYPVSKYRSTETGLTVCVSERCLDGPQVHCDIYLATEADDDGLSHCVNHMLFHGCEEKNQNRFFGFFKGILDQFANRCLASGTNAWTETDHTCYTMTNAGSEGFLKLLPIYMDHILYPTITESGYLTEVHHIDGSGADGGNVYREIKASENTAKTLTDLAMMRAMYPGVFRYCTLKNLRESTSLEKVKRYHREFYRPENLFLVIRGPVKPDDVFAALEPVERKIMAKCSNPAPSVGENHPNTSQMQGDRQNPTPIPALTETLRETIYYPSDEKTGRLIIGFRGPKSQSLYEAESVSRLIDYLDTGHESLWRDMERFTSYEGSFYLGDYYGCCSMFCRFEKADVENIEDLETAFMDVLKKIANGEETIDMNSMVRIIKDIYVGPDSDDHIGLGNHFIYGGDNKDLYGRLNTVEICDKMKSEPVEYWLNLLKQYFIDSHRVVIIGLPSRTLQAEMRKEEEERLEKQKEDLGVEGLKECKLRLERAKEENAVVSGVFRPSPDCQQFHHSSLLICMRDTSKSHI